jgi:hypothetical protein
MTGEIGVPRCSTLQDGDRITPHRRFDAHLVEASRRDSTDAVPVDLEQVEFRDSHASRLGVAPNETRVLPVWRCLTPANWRALVESNPFRICELLVGLPAVSVLGVVSRENEPLRVHVERVEPVAGCPVCGVVGT